MIDTSETYIKMCEKATEIQALKETLPHDPAGYLCLVVFKEVICPKCCHEISGCNYCPDCGSAAEHVELPRLAMWTLLSGSHPTWLPRQDQLQEMVLLPPEDGFPEGDNVLRLCWEFGLWVNDPEVIWDSKIEENEHESCRYSWPRFTSMEQLWLAFVMKEKYGKTWNGEDWV